MEPQGFPLNDPGKQALMTSLSPEENHERLDWVLSRIAGYVGAVGAEGSLRGERFAALPEINPVLAELSRGGCCMSILARKRRRCRGSGAGASMSCSMSRAPRRRHRREAGTACAPGAGKGSALGFAGTVGR